MSLTPEQRQAVAAVTRRVFAEFAIAIAKEGIPRVRYLEAETSDQSGSVRVQVRNQLRAGSVTFGDADFEDHEFRLVLREVYFDLLGSGLVVIGGLAKGMDYSLDVGAFTFTQRGLAVLTGSDVLLFETDSLSSALRSARTAGTLTIEDTEIALLAEAQHCWQTGCFRAAAVLIGLANEARCMALVDAVGAALPAPKSTDMISDLAAAKDASKSFSYRWRPTLRLLEGCRSKLLQLGRGKPWWEPWEGVPGVLSTLGEAVRLSRNTAAHDPHQEFGRSDVALLLAAMPHQVQAVCTLEAFFRNVPVGVTLPTL